MLQPQEGGGEEGWLTKFIPPPHIVGVYKSSQIYVYYYTVYTGDELLSLGYIRS